MDTWLDLLWVGLAPHSVHHPRPACVPLCFHQPSHFFVVVVAMPARRSPTFQLGQIIYNESNMFLSCPFPHLGAHSQHHFPLMREAPSLAHGRRKVPLREAQLSVRIALFFQFIAPARSFGKWPCLWSARLMQACSN